MRVGRLLVMGLLVGGCEARHTAPDAAPSDTVDAATTPAPFPAPHPSPPQVVTQGGPVLKAPRIVPIFFSNDDPTTVANLGGFLNQLVASSYWTATTQEYGVGAASVLPPVQIADAMNGLLARTDVESWLKTTLAAADSPLPAPDANTVYVIHYPETVALSDGNLPSCDPGGIGGYHANVLLDGEPVAYVAMPRCDNFYGLSGLDEMTGLESQMLVAAALDPFSTTNPAYDTMDNNHLYWVLYDEAASPIVLGEPPDLCARLVNPFLQPADLPYTVQRSWSNAAALAGQDPCVPTPAAEVYFAAAPELDDEMPTSFVGGQSGNMASVNIPVGQSATVTLDLFSDSPVGPWKVEVDDFNHLLGNSPMLSFSLDRSEGQNGDKLHVTITPTLESPTHADLFVVTSRLGAQVNSWVGVVGD